MYTVAVSSYGGTNLGADFVNNLTNTQQVILKGLGLNDVQLDVRNASSGTNYRVALTLRTSNYPSARQAVNLFQSNSITYPVRSGSVPIQAIAGARNMTIALNATVTVLFQTRGAGDTTSFAASRAASALNTSLPACGGWCNASFLMVNDFNVAASVLDRAPLTPPPPTPPSPPPGAPPDVVPVAVPALLDQGRTAGIAIGAACIVLGLVAAVAVFIRIRFKTRPPPRAPVNSVALVAKDEEYGEEEYGEEGEEEGEDEGQSIGEYEEEDEEEDGKR